jgi:hypothetical protein
VKALSHIQRSTLSSFLLQYTAPKTDYRALKNNPSRPGISISIWF